MDHVPRPFRDDFQQAILYVRHALILSRCISWTLMDSHGLSTSEPGCAVARALAAACSRRPHVALRPPLSQAAQWTPPGPEETGSKEAESGRLDIGGGDPAAIPARAS